MVDVRRITERRLIEWSETLIKFHCTPALLIGIGHDHTSGEIHICIPENTPGPQLELLLEGVLARVRAGKHLPGGFDPGDD